MSEELKQNRTALKVPVSTYTQNLGGSVDDDEWSRDSYSDSNSLDGYAYITDKVVDSYYDIVPVGAEVKPGDIVYVLWAEYSTGDTFHRHDGKYELIAAFVDPELAHKNAQACRGSRDDDGWSMNIELDDGSTFSYHIPWLGYFESLEGIRVESLTVKAKTTY